MTINLIKRIRYHHNNRKVDIIIETQQDVAVLRMIS